MSDDGKSVILNVETYGLQLFIYLDFGKTKVTVEVLVQDFHELKPKENKWNKLEISLMSNLPLFGIFSINIFFQVSV